MIFENESAGMLVKTLERLQNNKSDSRELDGRIAFSVLAHPVDDTFFVFDKNELPCALLTKAPGTIPKPDLIEFEHPEGGWVAIHAARVKHYTTSFDAALSLLPEGTRWSISETGLVKACYEAFAVKEKLQTPILGLCGVGLKLQLCLSTRVFLNKG